MTRRVPSTNADVTFRRNLKRPRWAEAAALLTAIVLAGCGRTDGPQVEPVSGTVYYGGEPLAEAIVVFSPVSGERKASATTDDEGRFELSTFGNGDGAIVGEHVVTIVKRGPRKLPPVGTPGRGMPGGPSAPGDPLIPEKYFSPDTSGLTAEVTAGGNNLDFHLED